MPFDESGHQRRTGQVDDRRARSVNTAGWTRRVDTCAAHTHVPSLVQLDAVEDTRGPQDGHCLRRRRLTCETSREGYARGRYDQRETEREAGHALDDRQNQNRWSTTVQPRLNRDTVFATDKSVGTIASRR